MNNNANKQVAGDAEISKEDLDQVTGGAVYPDLASLRSRLGRGSTNIFVRFGEPYVSTPIPIIKGPVVRPTF